MNFYTLQPVLGTEAVPLSTILAGLVTIGIMALGIIKLWYDRHISKSDLALVAANATRTEQQRLEKLVVAPLVTVAAETDKATQILYFGHDSTDTAPVLEAFQEYGISNRIITKLTIDSALEYLADHPGKTFCIIVYMTDMETGEELLKMLKANALTQTIPVVGINGFSDTERVRLFEAGIEGFLAHPFMMSALMLILTRLGFKLTISKTR